MDFDPQKPWSGGHWDTPEALKIGTEKVDFYMKIWSVKK